MPPKRKRNMNGETAAAATETNGTRRSTRKTGDSDTVKSSSTGTSRMEIDDSDGEMNEPTKTSTKQPPAKKTKTGGTSKKKKDEQNGTTKGSATVSAPQPATSFNELDPKTYTLPRLQSLFAQYADADDPNVIGTEGLMKLFEDAEISMEGALPFLFAWAVRAENFGTFTKAEWEKLGSMRIDTLAKLKLSLLDLESVMFDQPKREPKVDEYDRHLYRTWAMKPKDAFNNFYHFCFGLAKKSEARVLEMEMATAIWTVVLVPKYKIMQSLLEFIAEHPKYKAVNKDLWTMMLEFCNAMQNTENMNTSEDESWPSMLDEFMEWKKVQPAA
ncbi:hypothetical protein FRC02_010884 [Tulasnella sp. 418]|nr:hypothetical protein FRC02_010884 [Tulasnella sp. 418]